MFLILSLHVCFFYLIIAFAQMCVFLRVLEFAGLVYDGWHLVLQLLLDLDLLWFFWTWHVSSNTSVSCSAKVRLISFFPIMSFGFIHSAYLWVHFWMQLPTYNNTHSRKLNKIHMRYLLWYNMWEILCSFNTKLDIRDKKNTF